MSSFCSRSPYDHVRPQDLRCFCLWEKWMAFSESAAVMLYQLNADRFCPVHCVSPNITQNMNIVTCELIRLCMELISSVTSPKYPMQIKKLCQIWWFSCFDTSPQFECKKKTHFLFSSFFKWKLYVKFKNMVFTL